MRHRFHALCPYFAMFPESFAEHWVKQLTRKGDTVLDPFCGRGTLPFQALLMGRKAIGSDINDVAYCVTRAKTNAPTLASVKRRLTQLENEFAADGFEVQRRKLPEFFHVAYRPATLRQVLCLRQSLKWRSSDVDCMVAALTLGVLHGESERSPSFLSAQMPHTISTKPDYSVRFWRERDLHAPKRDAFELLRTQAEYRYKSERPEGTASIYHTDMRDLPRIGLPDGIKCVVTSPPYFDVTSYQEDQWLRGWFLGGPSKPCATRTEERTSDVDRYWRLIGDMWRMLGLVLARRAHVVIRIGAVRYAPNALAKQLLGTAVLSKRKVTLAGQWVSQLRKRQTDSFRPGSKGCSVEVDCHFEVH
jgi:hypothetical protein